MVNLTWADDASTIFFRSRTIPAYQQTTIIHCR